MKENYSDNVKEMLKFTKSTAYFNFRKACDNFWNLYKSDPNNVFFEIEYSDYVKEECPSFNYTKEEATFDIPAYDIVKWIAKEGSLEINDFINLNKDNEIAMALLDYVLTEKYYEELETVYNNNFIC